MKKEDESIYSGKGPDQKAILQFSDCKEGHEGDTKTCVFLIIQYCRLASCLISLIQKTCLCSTGTSSSSLPCVLKKAREAKSSYLPTIVLLDLHFYGMLISRRCINQAHNHPFAVERRDVNERCECKSRALQLPCVVSKMCETPLLHCQPLDACHVPENLVHRDAPADAFLYHLNQGVAKLWSISLFQVAHHKV